MAWKNFRAIKRAFSEWDKKSAEKPRLWNSTTKQMVVLGVLVALSAYVGVFLLKYSVLDGDKWRMLATSQQLSSVVIKANRGSIYDKNGTVLAQSSTVWDITISPHNIENANNRAKEQYEKDAKKLIEKG